MNIIHSTTDSHGSWYRAVIDGETWDYVDKETGMIKLYAEDHTTSMFELYCVAAGRSR